MDETRDVFAVETLRSHHDDAASPQNKRPQKNAIVPQTINRRAAAFRRVPMLLTHDIKARRAGDGVDEKIEKEIGGANQKALLE